MQSWMVEEIWKERWPRRLLKLAVIFSPFWASRWAGAYAGEKWGSLTFLGVLLLVAAIVRAYWWTERPSGDEPPIGPIF